MATARLLLPEQIQSAVLLKHFSDGLFRRAISLHAPGEAEVMLPAGEPALQDNSATPQTTHLQTQSQYSGSTR
jgi:hypothetical protein